MAGDATVRDDVIDRTGGWNATDKRVTITCSICLFYNIFMGWGVGRRPPRVWRQYGDNTTERMLFTWLRSLTSFMTLALTCSIRCGVIRRHPPANVLICRALDMTTNDASCDVNGSVVTGRRSSLTPVSLLLDIDPLRIYMTPLTIVGGEHCVSRSSVCPSVR